VVAGEAGTEEEAAEEEEAMMDEAKVAELTKEFVRAAVELWPDEDHESEEDVLAQERAVVGMGYPPPEHRSAGARSDELIHTARSTPGSWKANALRLIGDNETRQEEPALDDFGHYMEATGRLARENDALKKRIEEFRTHVGVVDNIARRTMDRTGHVSDIPSPATSCMGFLEADLKHAQQAYATAESARQRAVEQAAEKDGELAEIERLKFVNQVTREEKRRAFCKMDTQYSRARNALSNLRKAEARVKELEGADAAWQNAVGQIEKKDGQLAAMREALIRLRNIGGVVPAKPGGEPDLRGGQAFREEVPCHQVVEKALATDAGKSQAAVIAAAVERVEAETEDAKTWMMEYADPKRPARRMATGRRVGLAKKMQKEAVHAMLTERR
jgi:hypothetical protein